VKNLKGCFRNYLKKVSIVIKDELSEKKDFYERNLEFMVHFIKEYCNDALIPKQLVSEFEMYEDKSILNN